MKGFVFISSPYSGNEEKNVELQFEAWHLLMDAGYTPLSPLVGHYLHAHRKRTYDEWINWDLKLISVCDTIIRLRPLDENGIELPSNGADLEQAEAERLGLKYLEFQTTSELLNFLTLNPYED